MSLFDSVPIFSVPEPPPRMKGRREEIKSLSRLIGKLKTTSIQIHGEHGVGKSALLYAIARRVRAERSHTNIVLIECRATVQDSRGGTKTREGVVRDLAVATGGLLGLDALGREAELLRRLHQGRWVVMLDGYEATVGGDADAFVRRLGLVDHLCLVLGTAQYLSWPSLAKEVRGLPKSTVEAMIAASTRGVALRVRDISDVADATRGLPELAARAGDLLQSGCSAESTILRVRTDFASYYAEELAQLEDSPRARGIVSLLVAVTAPLSIREMSEILLIDEAAVVDAVSQLRRQRLLIQVETKYKPHDALAAVAPMNALDGRVLGLWWEWLSSKLGPARRAYTWSKCDIDLCEPVSGHIRSFFRLDHLVLTDGKSGDPDAYAGLAAQLAGWLYTQGYWLELERASKLISDRLWAAKNVPALIKVHLLWNLKGLIKASKVDESLLEVATVNANLDQLEPADRALLSAALVTSMGQLRHTLGAGGFRASTGQAVRVITPPNPSVEDVILAERILAERGELELLAMSLTRRGNIAAELRDSDGAYLLYQEVVDICCANSDQRWSEEVSALALGNIGILRNRDHQWQDAERLLSSVAPRIAQVSERMVVHAELARAYNGLRKQRLSNREWATATMIAAKLGLAKPLCESDPTWAPKRRKFWGN